MRAAAATHERHDLNIFEAGFERDIVSLIVLQKVFGNRLDAMNTG